MKMNYDAWQLKRRELAEVEKKERSENWEMSRAPLQAAITEQAIRDLYDRVDELEKAARKGK